MDTVLITCITCKAHTTGRKRPAFTTRVRMLGRPGGRIVYTAMDDKGGFLSGGHSASGQAGPGTGQGFESAMYHDYFGISEDPFSITPDTRYLFLSERHRNAFAHLLYGVSEGGCFVQLTGEVGTGKTLLCRNLLAKLPEEVNVALIFNPRLTPLELVANICDELGIHYPLGCDSIKEIVDFLNAYLLESHSHGRRTVVIIDEAQNLSYEALEQVRLLTNLETEKQKLLQIILVGQPELKRLLEQPNLRQLAQRVTARYHLMPLSAQETRSYVLHRLQVAGLRTQLFESAALNSLYRLSGGVPRTINVLCGRAMLAAYGAGRRTIDRSLLQHVARELSGEEPDAGPPTRLAWVAGMLLLAATGLWLLQEDRIRNWFSDVAQPKISGETAAPATQEAMSGAAMAASAATQRPPASAEVWPMPDGVVSSTDEAVAAQKAPLATHQPAGDAGALPQKPEGHADVEASPAESEATAVAQIATEGSDTARSPGAAPGKSDGDDPADTVPADSGPQQASQPETGLVLVDMLSDRSNAFATLFGYWQSVYPTDDESLSACERAERVGLSCIYGRGDWQNLAYYNRPAVIELLLDDGNLYQAVVARLDDERVTLDLEVRRLSLPRREIDALWTGSYIVLWRPPKLSAETLSLGAKGRDVAWLISMLDRIEGVSTPPATRSAVFDRTLKTRVMRFQRSQGLLSDGIVGRHTIIQLSLAVDDGMVPVLRGDAG